MILNARVWHILLAFDFIYICVFENLTDILKKMPLQKCDTVFA